MEVAAADRRMGQYAAVVRQCIEAMDGIQLRWTRKPPIDLYDEWLVFERMIFPSPVWDGYR